MVEAGEIVDERPFARFFVVRAWISGRFIVAALESRISPLSSAERDSCCRRGNVPLSKSIFASLDAYFRAYLHALDNAGAAGALA